jgi:hypothetical protein
MLKINKMCEQKKTLFSTSCQEFLEIPWALKGAFTGLNLNMLPRECKIFKESQQ